MSTPELKELLEKMAAVPGVSRVRFVQHADGRNDVQQTVPGFFVWSKPTVRIHEMPEVRWTIGGKDHGFVCPMKFKANGSVDGAAMADCILQALLNQEARKEKT